MYIWVYIASKYMNIDVLLGAILTPKTVHWCVRGTYTKKSSRSIIKERSSPLKMKYTLSPLKGILQLCRLILYIC
jgi:hypothetical protein